MKQAVKWVRRATFGAVSLAILGLAPVSVSAEGYAELDNLPRWDKGVWYPDFAKLFSARRPAAPAYTPEAAAAVKEFNEKRGEGENLQTSDANCLPPGVPRIMQMPYPIEFLFTPGRVTILTEAYMQVRRIYTDGRQLPQDPDPAFNGNSVGHWDGDTLVVETVGINEHTTLMQGTPFHPTDQTRIVERIHQTAPDTLMDEMTITDPSIFTEPYHTSIAFTLKPDWQVREYICEENNRDAADPFGRPTMDVSIPDDLKN